MFNKLLVFTLFTLLLLLQGCSRSSDESSGSAETLVASNELELTDTRNNSYTIVKEGDRYILKGYENRIVIFDIFATWCQPCRDAMPHLASLQKKFPDDLLVIGITIEDGLTNAQLETFKSEHGADYIIFNSKNNRALYRSIASSINVGQQFPIPLMVMYKNGSYVTHYMGLVAEEMIESDIKRILKAE